MRGRPFKKGQSGNPGGRPRVVAELRALAHEHAPEVIKELARLALKARSESVRVSAIRELLDRGYGKATLPPVHFELPVLASAGDASKAIAAITAAVAHGEIAAAEAADLSRLIETFTKAIEANEIERRLQALEERQARETVRGNHL